jgi:hypothetical protein
MIKPDNELGAGFSLFIFFMVGIIVFLLGYLLLMFISLIDMQTGALFDWSWLWWSDINQWEMNQ